MRLLYMARVVVVTINNAGRLQITKKASGSCYSGQYTGCTHIVDIDKTVISSISTVSTVSTGHYSLGAAAWSL